MQVALALPLPPAPRAPGGKNPSVHNSTWISADLQLLAHA